MARAVQLQAVARGGGEGPGAVAARLEDPGADRGWPVTDPGVGAKRSREGLRGRTPGGWP